MTTNRTMSRSGPCLGAALLMLGTAGAAAAQSAPDTSDKCTSNVNQIPQQANEPRSCASAGTGGAPLSYGQPNEVIYGAVGNGRAGPTYKMDIVTGDQGWSNALSGTSNSGNSVAASSSLIDGTLHGSISNGGVPYTTGSTINTRISDVLTFTNTSGAAAVVTIGYAFDGYITPRVRTDLDWNDGGSVFMALNQPSGYYGPIRFAGSGGYVSSGARSDFYANDGLTQRTDQIDNPADYRFTGSYDRTTGQVSGTFSTDLLIPIGSSDLGFALTMGLDCRSLNVACDFGHTGRVGLGALPTGLSYASRSGVFLTAATDAVPEPASWALTIGGVGLIGGALRRRRGPALRTA